MRHRTRWGFAALMLMLAHGAPARGADRMEPPPEALRTVGVNQRLNNQIPIDTVFQDDMGRTVRLKDYLDGGRPVILLLGYYECPMLCSLVLNGLTDALKNVNWTPGRQFRIVFVSINPAETVPLARIKKQNYVKEYGRAETADGWHFLVGDHSAITALAGAVGFGYTYDKAKGQYAHPATLMFLTPDGRVSRYLAGIKFEPRDVKLALYEAAHGKIGTPVEQVFLSCYHYDADQGAYAPAAMRIMQLGGAATVLILAAVLSGLWVRDRARPHKSR